MAKAIKNKELMAPGGLLIEIWDKVGVRVQSCGTPASRDVDNNLIRLNPVKNCLKIPILLFTRNPRK